GPRRRPVRRGDGSRRGRSGPGRTLPPALRGASCARRRVGRREDPRVTVRGRELAARLGPYGVWCSQLQWQHVADARAAVARIEELGFGAVWVGEATGREAITHAALL